MPEREQFDWAPTIREMVGQWCQKHSHPPGPPIIRVTDFTGQDPAIRLKFTSRQCDCGARLYIDGPVEVREVIRPHIDVAVRVGANEGQESQA